MVINEMFNFDIRLIGKIEALNFVQKYHYSNTLPKLNKFFVGFYLDNKLVGCVTLGWGTRPLHTIQRIFPSLTSDDYFEIGRMCMTEDMPRNSESQMLSQLIKWMRKNLPQTKVLFTWADGMLGKVGYVYQASNFLYAGYSGGEIYLMKGTKIHPRQMKSFLVSDYKKDLRKGVRPTMEQMIEQDIEHYKGKQYRYLYFLCEKKEEKKLRNECLIDLSMPYPKNDDLTWKRKNYDGDWVSCTLPDYQTDTTSRKRFELLDEQLSLW